jgi:hypothetical protein
MISKWLLVLTCRESQLRFEEFIMIVEIFESLNAYWELFEFCLALLTFTLQNPMIDGLLRVFKRFQAIFTTLPHAARLYPLLTSKFNETIKPNGRFHFRLYDYISFLKMTPHFGYTVESEMRTPDAYSYRYSINQDRLAENVRVILENELKPNETDMSPFSMFMGRKDALQFLFLEMVRHIKEKQSQRDLTSTEIVSLILNLVNILKYIIVSTSMFEEILFDWIGHNLVTTSDAEWIIYFFVQLAISYCFSFEKVLREVLIPLFQKANQNRLHYKNILLFCRCIMCITKPYHSNKIDFNSWDVFGLKSLHQFYFSGKDQVQTFVHFIQVLRKMKREAWLDSSTLSELSNIYLELAQSPSWLKKSCILHSVDIDDLLTMNDDPLQCSLTALELLSTEPLSEPTFESLQMFLKSLNHSVDFHLYHFHRILARTLSIKNPGIFDIVAIEWIKAYSNVESEVDSYVLFLCYLPLEMQSKVFERILETMIDCESQTAYFSKMSHVIAAFSQNFAFLEQGELENRVIEFGNYLFKRLKAILEIYQVHILIFS